MPESFACSARAFVVNSRSKMNKRAHQELITDPPVRCSRESSVVQWLLGREEGRFFLPIAGLWILGLDWLLFSQDTVTLGLSTPLTSVLGFLIGSIGTYHFQRRFAADDGPRAGWKAFLAGLVVGVPLPLAGTIVGAWIVAKSGLAGLKDRLSRR
jgi:hypothetical protein